MNYKNITVEIDPPAETHITVRMPMSTASILLKLLNAGAAGPSNGPRGVMDVLGSALTAAGVQPVSFPGRGFYFDK